MEQAPYPVYCMHSGLLALGHFLSILESGGRGRALALELVIAFRASEYYSGGFMISISQEARRRWSQVDSSLPIETVFLAAMQSPVETPVAKVVSYVLFNWLTQKMDDPKATEVTRTTPTKNDFLYGQLPPLQHTSTELIRGRHYALHLYKEPRAYWMKELIVKWLPLLDATELPEFFPTTINSKVVSNPSGFYRVVSEISEDQEYLVELHITRI